MKNIEIVLRLAWRNIWRNKRRTILTFMTIIVGSAMILLLNAIAKGGHDQMIEDAVSSNTGHIQIHEKGYWENRTIDYAIQPDKSLTNFLENNDNILGYSERIHADGLLSFGKSTAGSMIQAVDPEKEKSVTNLHTKILEGGRYLLPGDRTEIVIGETLAKNLGAKVGNVISMISQGFDGSIAAEKLKIVGLFRSGNPEYDQGLIIMPLAQADNTFTMMGYVHSITIRLHSSSDSELVISGIKKKTDPETTEIMNWSELMPELVQFIVMDDVQAYIFDAILFMVVAFGILNTIQMSIIERTREFGVMLSIGTSPKQIISIVLLESLFITLIGIAIGLVIGYAVSYYYYVNPINFSNYAEEMTTWGISTTLFPADATTLSGAMTAIITLILCMLFSIFPARRAAKLNPIEAIRHL